MCNGRCWRRYHEDNTMKNWCFVKLDFFLRAPNSDEIDFFKFFFLQGFKLVIIKPMLKFCQKILTLSYLKTSGKTGHPWTIRGHLGLTRRDRPRDPRCYILGQLLHLVRIIWPNWNFQRPIWLTRRTFLTKLSFSKISFLVWKIISFQIVAFLVVLHL